MPSRTYPLSAPPGEVPVTVIESGTGRRPVLLLHGGAGPDSVTGFGGALAERFPVRVLSPVYPGFSGTARPGWLDSIAKLAGVCRRLLEDQDLTGVLVAGSSIGGWVAAELALAAPERVGQLVLGRGVPDGAGGWPPAAAGEPGGCARAVRRAGRRG